MKTSHIIIIISIILIVVFIYNRDKVAKLYNGVVSGPPAVLGTGTVTQTTTNTNLNSGPGMGM